MRIKKIENISQEDVQLDLGQGTNLTLKPGVTFKNIRVENLNSVKEKVKVISDLGEINENHSNTNKLYD